MSAIVGILLSLGGTLCNAVGYTLQKLAHRRADAALLAHEADEAARLPDADDLAEAAAAAASAAASALLAGGLHSASAASSMLDGAGSTLDAALLARDDGVRFSSAHADGGAALHASLLPRGAGDGGGGGGGGGSSAALAISADTLSGSGAPTSSRSSGVATPSSARTRRRQRLAAARVGFWHFWQFWAGLAIIAGGAALGVVAYGYAGQAELGPIGAVTLVWIQLLSWRVLKERFSLRDGAAAALMLAGTVLALVFADASDATYDLDGVLSMMRRPAAAIYAGVVAALLAAAGGAMLHWGRTRAAALPPAAAAADAFLRPFVGGVLVGVTGLFVKATVEVVSAAVRAHSAADLRRLPPYAFAAALVASLLCQVLAFNSGLARYPANVVAPIYQITLVFSDVAAGWVVWDEAAAQTPRALAAFAVGCAVSMSGVALLALKVRRPGVVGADEGVAAVAEEVDDAAAAAAEAAAAASAASAADTPRSWLSGGSSGGGDGASARSAAGESVGENEGGAASGERPTPGSAGVQLLSPREHGAAEGGAMGRRAAAARKGRAGQAGLDTGVGAIHAPTLTP